MQKLSTNPELNRLAIKNNIDASYIVWVILQSETKREDLSSHYTRKQAKDTCKKYGLNYTDRHFSRLFKQGNNVLWGLGQGTIHLRSFKRVYNRLADDQAKMIASPNYIVITIHKSSQARRAELYHSWFYHRGEITLSRATIQEIFNITPEQQRSYEKLLGSRMIVNTNYCHIDSEKYSKNPLELPDHSYTFKQEKYANNRVSHDTVIAYQLPNTFTARNDNHGVSPIRFAPRRALNACRKLYGTTTNSYKSQRYFKHYDLYKQSAGNDVYIRRYYQGKKRINSLGHYLYPLISV